MAYLTFHTKEYPRLTALGARFVVVAVYGEWRDADVTNDRQQIARVERELRKRFMTRFEHIAA